MSPAEGVGVFNFGVIEGQILLDTRALGPIFSGVKALLHAFIDDRFPASLRSLSMSVVYEDSDTHRQATAFYEFILRQLDESACVSATWWRTSLLGDPKLSRVAAHAIAASDLILVSVHDGSEPSNLIKEWVESWPIDSRRPPRMVGLLDGRVEDSNSDWDEYLQDVARRWNMPYLAGALSTITEPPTATTRDETMGADPPVQPYAHWGLNE
jgi:hypothetical protein